MVMPMSSSKDVSMFPTFDYNYSSFQEECWKDFRVKPRPRWITTEFGGHVSEWCFSNLYLPFNSNFIVIFALAYYCFFLLAVCIWLGCYITYFSKWIF